MVEGAVGPSELHLKKELSVLQKARPFRDPETSSTWRSPLSSKSLAAASSALNGDGTSVEATGKSRSKVVAIALRSEKQRRKVQVHNWKKHSNKSCEIGMKREGDAARGTEKNNGASQSNSLVNDSKRDTYLDGPITGSKSQSKAKKHVRQSKRNLVSKKGVNNHSDVSKLLELPTGSLGADEAGEQSDDSENHNSDCHGAKSSHPSGCVSPFFSASGCGNWSNPSRILRSLRDGSSRSCTPASTSSYYRYGGRNCSNLGSWDGTAASFDGDDLDLQYLSRNQGCGISCYWSKKSKDRVCTSCYSPSLSDTLRRKGSAIFSGSHNINNKKSSACNKKSPNKTSPSLPLLTSTFDGGCSSTFSACDELSSNLGELDLEALSRLDGRRWSSCKSQEGIDPTHGGSDMEMPDQRSLSQKYRPRSFEEIIGQNFVAQSLSNAILRERIAPAYLFQGPRGTGKTSIAKIFTSALNCIATVGTKPCGICKECTGVSRGIDSNLVEVEATNKNSINKVRYLLRSMSAASSCQRYKVFVIDECHMVSTKMWSAFMKFLDEPLPHVVFIFITIDSDNLPRSIVSRCQKYIFSKIKDSDIVYRLRKICEEEKLDVELDALDLIALNSDGSIRDAETMLDQLSLLGHKITPSLVNDLIGVVSEEKLIDLLELAMSSDTAETVRKSRELLDSGVDPVALMSQLAGLIMDIIAGTYQLTDSRCNESTVSGRRLTEAELERLQEALKILSDAEKQIRNSCERSTWFTAALLQLGSGQSSDLNQSRSSSRACSNATRDFSLDVIRDSFGKSSQPSHNFHESKPMLSSRAISGCSSPHGIPSSSSRIKTSKHLAEGVVPVGPNSSNLALLNSACTSNSSERSINKWTNEENIGKIWRQCIEKCHSKTLKQLLSNHAQLMSIGECEGSLMVCIAFESDSTKSHAERFLSSITNSIETVLLHNVEVRLGLMPNAADGARELAVDKEMRMGSDMFSLPGFHGPNSSLCLSHGSLDHANEEFHGARESKVSSSSNARIPGSKVHDISGNVSKSSAIDEQRLESAWLQAVEKYNPGMLTQFKPERNQILPQNGTFQNLKSSSMSHPVSAKHLENDINSEITSLMVNNNKDQQTDRTGGRANGYTFSPSLLHSRNHMPNFDKEHQGYESGPGCNGLFCWKTQKLHGEKEKKKNSRKSRHGSHLSLFGACSKIKGR